MYCTDDHRNIAPMVAAFRVLGRPRVEFHKSSVSAICAQFVSRSFDSSLAFRSFGAIKWCRQKYKPHAHCVERGISTVDCLSHSCGMVSHPYGSHMTRNMNVENVYCCMNWFTFTTNTVASLSCTICSQKIGHNSSLVEYRTQHSR